jgi:hypothetical protein
LIPFSSSTSLIRFISIKLFSAKIHIYLKKQDKFIKLHRERWQDCTLWQSFGWSVGLCGFANVCNVGGVSFFFCGGKKKTK